jgi:dolichyl-phosphate beta-glucosyltransferase
MPKTAIIIPCYNEHKRLDAATILQFLSGNPGITIIFVNDGSKDDTSAIIDSIRHQNQDQVSVVHHPKRMGKAEAVRTGLRHGIDTTDAAYLGYLDADLAVSLQEFSRLSEILSKNGKQFIFGSRIKKIGSVITRNEWRHFYGRFIATLVGYITRLDVYDTQCSAKIFNRDLVPALIEQPFHTKWLFDVELIDRIRKSKGDLNNMGHEEPLLKWNEIKGSKLRWYNFPRILRELFILRKYCRKK